MNAAVRLFLILLGCSVVSVQIIQAGTLQEVLKRGSLNCGVANLVTGFSEENSQGERIGFDVDFCRGLAAVLGVELEFVEASSRARLALIRDKKIDVLYRSTTHTSSRDADLDLTFVGVNYYDGQGFMVKESIGASSVRDLDGVSICVLEATTTALNLEDYFKLYRMNLNAKYFPSDGEMVPAYEQGECDALTSDASNVAGMRTTLKDPTKHVILPELISKEPLGPVVKEGDDEWADIVRWAYYCTVEAEELGITQANVNKLAADSNDPRIKRLLGTAGNSGKELNLPNDWCVREIAKVGNYGEIFERNLGLDTDLKIERGLNAQWYEGGLQYSPPVR